MVKCGVVLAAMVCGVLVYGSRRAFAVEGVVNASYGIVDKCILMFRNAWPKTLWPWKVRELAEKEPENGVFRLLRNDVTWFLTTILIGTTIYLCTQCCQYWSNCFSYRGWKSDIW
ncbi:putative DUF21 domain-containing protein At3g13070, chloroplastic isoform X2 [Rosa chinensis]|uniref:putative DUF21 domain-containing protein At3g13070, chloroplastic isoform X2 n=1 Tax=Rosa chinensis TaxID=74649 RepID=UPI001AD8F9CC|nr:putative DUF21 domain-containing protein At3g13070, chloroplastic isoform X2 [Rosa chinensis]